MFVPFGSSASSSINLEYNSEAVIEQVVQMNVFPINGHFVKRALFRKGTLSDILENSNSTAIQPKYQSTVFLKWQWALCFPNPHCKSLDALNRTTLFVYHTITFCTPPDSSISFFDPDISGAVLTVAWALKIVHNPTNGSSLIRHKQSCLNTYETHMFFHCRIWAYCFRHKVSLCGLSELTIHYF